MPDELPTWAFLISHILTIAGGGGLGAWLSGRGKNKEGEAALVKARAEADSGLWMRMEAEVERLDRKLDEERRECDERIGRLESDLADERKSRRELQETVSIMVQRFDDLSEPLPAEIGP